MYNTQFMPTSMVITHKISRICNYMITIETYKDCEHQACHEYEILPPYLYPYPQMPILCAYTASTKNNTP